MAMAAILIMWPGPFEQTFVPQSHGGIIWNLTDWPSGFGGEVDDGRWRPTYTIGKTVIPVSARFKELAQLPPHKRFDTWMWFFDHSYGFVGTLSPCIVVHKVSTARYVRYLLET